MAVFLIHILTNFFFIFFLFLQTRNFHLITLHLTILIDTSIPNDSLSSPSSCRCYRGVLNNRAVVAVSVCPHKQNQNKILDLKTNELNVKQTIFGPFLPKLTRLTATTVLPHTHKYFTTNTITAAAVAVAAAAAAAANFLHAGKLCFKKKKNPHIWDPPVDSSAVVETENIVNPPHLVLKSPAYLLPSTLDVDRVESFFLKNRPNGRGCRLMGGD